MTRPVDLDAAFGLYWSYLVTGDRASALRLALELGAQGASVSDILAALVSRAQLEVGRLWAAHEWDVAQEHRATSISDDVVAALSATVAEPEPPLRHALLTCAEGEWHALPLRMLATGLRERGWQVTSLGASVPARHLHQILHDLGPDVVGLSSSLPTRLFDARRTIEVSRSAGVPVLAGGPAFGPEGRWALALGATAWAPNAAAMVTASIPRFVEAAPPVPSPDDAPLALRRAQEDIVYSCMKRLAALQLPDVDAYSDDQLARTREDFGFIAQYLAASLFVDDPSLFTEFAGWLARVLRARGVPVHTFVSGLGLVDGAVRDVGDFPRAHAFLEQGRLAALSATA